MSTELAEHEKDITGLSNALIASLRGEIKEAETLRAASAVERIDRRQETASQ